MRAFCLRHGIAFSSVRAMTPDELAALMRLVDPALAKSHKEDNAVTYISKRRKKP